MQQSARRRPSRATDATTETRLAELVAVLTGCSAANALAAVDGTGRARRDEDPLVRVARAIVVVGAR